MYVFYARQVAEPSYINKVVCQFDPTRKVKPRLILSFQTNAAGNRCDHVLFVVNFKTSAGNTLKQAGIDDQSAVSRRHLPLPTTTKLPLEVTQLLTIGFGQQFPRALEGRGWKNGKCVKLTTDLSGTELKSAWSVRLCNVMLKHRDSCLFSMSAQPVQVCLVRGTLSLNWVLCETVNCCNLPDASDIIF
jgi:hypothetical protein